jgi:hypothetical protein
MIAASTMPPPTPSSSSPNTISSLRLSKFPDEILLQISAYLPLGSLENLIASSPHLHDLTIGKPSYAPWRRRWEMFSRARRAAEAEAEMRLARFDGSAVQEEEEEGGRRGGKGRRWWWLGLSALRRC